AYFSSGASSKGIQVDIRGTYLQNAAEVRVTVHRGNFPDVVKTSKSTGGVINTIKAGNWTTAPIVIQSGTYNEAGSSSWVMPEAIWTPETIPTGVTVEILDATGNVIVSDAITEFGSSA